MAENETNVELENNLSLLSQGFYQKLREIAEQRLKLENETISSIGTELFSKSGGCQTRNVKPQAPKPFAVRLEPSLACKVAKSRKTTDELEEKLQETRLAFQDKQKTVQQRKEELDRREKVLVRSIQEIEVYLRAVFYLKQEADAMHDQLENVSKEQTETLEKLKDDYQVIKRRKDSILGAITTFEPSQFCLEKMVSAFPSFASGRELVQYYLVLKLLQKELLEKEKACREAQEELTRRRTGARDYARILPFVVISKETTLLDLNVQRRDLEGELTQLREQIDLAVLAKVKEDSAWFDVQRWIKKLFRACVRIRPPGPKDPPASGTLGMLDRITNFTWYAQQTVMRLRAEEGQRGK